MINNSLTFERLQNLSDGLILYCIQTVIQMTQTKTPTQRLIERINQKESFKDIAYLCEDFRAFVDEISEWGVDHIGGVDFYGVGFEFNEDAFYGKIKGMWTHTNTRKDKFDMFPQQELLDMLVSGM